MPNYLVGIKYDKPREMQSMQRLSVLDIVQAIDEDAAIEAVANEGKLTGDYFAAEVTFRSVALKVDY